MEILLLVQRVVEVGVLVVLVAVSVRLCCEVPNALRRRRARQRMVGAVGTAASCDEEQKPERVSFVNGLSHEADLEETIEEVLDWVVASAPAHRERPMACSCIREDQHGYIGVVRVDAHRSHFVRSFAGGSRRSVALGILTECAGWHGSPNGNRWMRENPACNRASCPDGGYISLLPPPPRRATDS